jgi:hypothetical protein
MSAHRALMMMGHIGELASRSHAWLREAEDAGDLYGEVWACLFSGAAMLAGDDVQGARDRVHAAIRRWSQDGFHFQHMLALVIETFCDLYEGRSGGAWQRLSEQWAAVEGSHILHWQFLRIFGLQLRAAAALAAAREQPHAEAVLLAAAERDASQLDLDGENRRDSAAAAALIRAGIAARTGAAPRPSPTSTRRSPASTPPIWPSTPPAPAAARASASAASPAPHSSPRPTAPWSTTRSSAPASGPPSTPPASSDTASSHHRITRVLRKCNATNPL